MEQREKVRKTFCLTFNSLIYFILYTRTDLKQICIPSKDRETWTGKEKRKILVWKKERNRGKKERRVYSVFPHSNSRGNKMRNNEMMVAVYLLLYLCK